MQDAKQQLESIVDNSVSLGKTAKVKVTSSQEPNVIGVAKRYEKEGVNHLIMVVGSDRVEEMQKLLARYNGKEFLFKKIDVVSSGERCLHPH